MPIETLEGLREHLQWAIALEHATLPPYLCALYSIREGHNEDAAEVLRSVFMEEMLHMTLAANILNAVGGEPEVDSPRMLPSYPAYLPHSNEAFLVSLEKFSPQALATFMKIERPEEHEGLPEDDEFETIGQFYEAIKVALKSLCEKLGERALFCGDPGRQVTGEAYYGGSGTIIAVDGLDSALAALGEVVEQGRAFSIARSGTAIATCSIPSAPRWRTTSASPRSPPGVVTGVATIRARVRRVSRSTSTGTPCTTCDRTRGRRTTRTGARRACGWRISTARTRACCICSIVVSTAVRSYSARRPG
jgi:hypothetical protein